MCWRRADGPCACLCCTCVVQASAAPNLETINELNREKSELTQSLRTAEANMSLVQNEVERAKEQALEMGRMLEERGTELRGAMGREAAAKEAKAAVELAIKRMQDEAVEAQRTIDGLRDEVAAAQTATATANLQWEDLHKENFELEKQIYGLQAELKAAENAVPPAVRARLDGLQSEVEQMRRELKQAVLDTQWALLAAGCPKKMKSDKDKNVPSYYSVGGSADGRGEVPWNVKEKRAMTPAEGVEWLANERDIALARGKR